MRKLPILFIAFFPYLIALVTYFIFRNEVSKSSLTTFAVSISVLVLFFAIVSIAVIIHMIFKWEAQEALLANLIVKAVYIPIHLALFFLMMAMGNPFLFIFMFLPVLISMVFMGVTGTVALAGIVKGYRKGTYRLSTAIIFGILSYCYIVDIIIAIVTYVKTKRRIV